MNSSNFTLPDQLWRGWVNPLTGIVPSQLGCAFARLNPSDVQAPTQASIPKIEKGRY